MSSLEGDFPESNEVPESKEERTIGYLRREAYAVRDCFTRYSVQILAVSAAISVAIARFFTEAPHIGVFGFFPIALILLVFSMGAHKYGTSNRLLGYELHLQRTGHFFPHDNCYEHMKTVGWEEAMRAWRFVAPTLFAKIYWPSDFIFRRVLFLCTSREINTLTRAGIANDDRFTGYWFDQKKSIHLLNGGYTNKVQYNPGGYLKTTISVFFVSILMCLGLPISEAIKSWNKYGVHHNIIDLSVVLLVITGTIGTLSVCLNIFSRIRILETGLLSIHSCCIIWEATVLAHLRALRELEIAEEEAKRPKSMHGYTNELAKQTREISKHAERIHKWIEDTRKWCNEHIPPIPRPPPRPPATTLPPLSHQ